LIEVAFEVFEFVVFVHDDGVGAVRLGEVEGFAEVLDDFVELHFGGCFGVGGEGVGLLAGGGLLGAFDGDGAVFVFEAGELLLAWVVAEELAFVGAEEEGFSGLGLGEFEVDVGDDFDLAAVSGGFDFEFEGDGSGLAGGGDFGDEFGKVFAKAWSE
jgi:hypothetical protein